MQFISRLGAHLSTWTLLLPDRTAVWFLLCHCIVLRNDTLKYQMLPICIYMYTHIWSEKKIELRFNKHNYHILLSVKHICRQTEWQNTYTQNKESKQGDQNWVYFMSIWSNIWLLCPSSLMPNGAAHQDACWCTCFLWNLLLRHPINKKPRKSTVNCYLALRLTVSINHPTNCNKLWSDIKLWF